ncbi:hypothetical protein FRC19_008378 [Serendipita sp. 401]|nr:hypothetical protein FRC19_008378 [Serendipita sp. 401]KAG9058755.1 hypothetical protein FS842_003544 [Serendipita sp. 407]
MCYLSRWIPCRSSTDGEAEPPITSPLAQHLDLAITFNSRKEPMSVEHDTDTEQIHSPGHLIPSDGLRRRPTKKWWQQASQQSASGHVEMKDIGSNSKFDHHEFHSEGEGVSRKRLKPKFRTRRVSSPEIVLPLTEEDKKAMKDAELLAKLPSAVDYAMLTAITCPWQPFPVPRRNNVREYSTSMENQPLLVVLPDPDSPQGISGKSRRKKDVTNDHRRPVVGSLEGGQNHDRVEH